MEGGREGGKEGAKEEERKRGGGRETEKGRREGGKTKTVNINPITKQMSKYIGVSWKDTVHAKGQYKS